MTHYDYPNKSNARHKLLAEMAREGKQILNLGDTNKSTLTKKLKKIGKVTTADITKGADIKVNLDKGLKTNKRFDTIIAGEVFEHVYHLKNLLKDLKKILRPKGQLIISIPNVCNLKSRIKVLTGKLPSFCADADQYGEGGHIRDFNLNTIKKVLEEAGFKIKKVKNIGLWYQDKRLIPPILCKTSFSDNILITALKSSQQ